MLKGLEWFYSNNIRKVEVGTDSLLIVQWITDTSKPPWTI